jgi:hypothetical protein
VAFVDGTRRRFSVHCNFQNGAELAFQGGGCQIDDTVNDDNGR